MNLTCSTIHPGRCILLISTDLKDAYCSPVTHLALTTYWLVTSTMRLNSIKHITSDLVFVGILNAMSSGLLFHSLSCAIFSCGAFPSFLFFHWGQRMSHLHFSYRDPQCLLLAMIKDLWKFLSQLFSRCTKAFFSINTDRTTLRGG